MTEPFMIATLVAVAALALALGWFIGRHFSNSKISRLQLDNAKLATTLEAERRTATEKLDAIAEMRDELTKTFASLSNQALRDHSERFLKLAQEKLKNYDQGSAVDLSKKPVDQLLQPVRKALDDASLYIEELDKDRTETFGSLPKHLELITHSQQILHSESRTLVDAMENPSKREEWSHSMLTRLAELADMLEHCEFVAAAENKASGEPSPDMVIHVPGDHLLVVEANTPLDAYVSTVRAPDEAVRSWQLERHARALHDRIRELSGRAYWSRFKDSPEFVVLLIPDEQYLSLALSADPELLDYALEKKVILATPTTLLSLLRVVAYGWQQTLLAEVTDNFRELGEAVYKRLSVITQHLSTLNSNLNRSIEQHYYGESDSEERVVEAEKPKKRKKALAE